MERAEFKNIIVRMPNWVGDLVMATPVLQDLRDRFPEATITAICASHITPILKYDPTINELFSFTKVKGFVHKLTQRSIIAKLQQGQFDLGVLMPNSFSSAWLFKLGQVQHRLGYKGQMRSLLLNHGVDFPAKRKDQHLTTTYKMMLEPLGIPVSKTSTRLFVTESEVQEAWDILSRFQVSPKNTVIGINPGAAYGSVKCWPPDRFRKVIEKVIAADPNHSVLLFGTPGQRKLIKEIGNGMPRQVVDLSGMTTIRQLMALISICNTFLTNDSGPMHIADALRVPLVSIFGSTSSIVTGPYHGEHVVKKDVDCSPCFKRTCPIDFRCMKRIGVDEISDLLLKIVREARG